MAIHQLSSGAYVRVSAPPALLLDNLRSNIPDPEIPVFKDEHGNEYENPSHPGYLRALESVEEKRTQLSLMGLIIFGFELVAEDGTPIGAPYSDEDNWEGMLRFVGFDWKRRFSEILGADWQTNLEDAMGSAAKAEDFARTKAYIMFRCISTADMSLLQESLGIPDKEVEAAVKSFQRS